MGKLTRIIARQAFKPGDFDIHEFLKTSIMHPQHYLVYEYTKRQGFYIYDNSLVEDYELAIRNWMVTLHCITEHPSMYYHTNTLDMLTKMTQMAICLNNHRLAQVTIFRGKHYQKASRPPITMQLGLDTHGELFFNQQV